MTETTNDPAEVPASVRKTERIVLIGLAVVIAIAAAVGWATVPTDAELVERASTGDDPRARVRAMNALVLRGYWEERPLAELTEFLDASPPEIRQFVADMHGSILRPR